MSLSQAKEWLDAFRPLPPETATEWRRRQEARLIYHSTALAGSTLTAREVERVLERGVMTENGPEYDQRQVLAHQAALELVGRLAESDLPVTEEEIRAVHALVVGEEEHDEESVHAARMARFHAGMREASVLHPVERASEIYRRIVVTRPFNRGNGRTGRLLMNLVLLRAGYPLVTLPTQRGAEIAAAMGLRARDATPALLALVCDSVEASLAEALILSDAESQTAPEGPGSGSVSIRPAMRAWLYAGRPVRPGEGASVPLPSLIARHPDETVRDLAFAISAAFAGVTREGGVSWSESDVIDAGGSDERRAEARACDLDQDWTELVADPAWQRWQEWPWSFLDPIGQRYYLPAMMVRGLLGDNVAFFNVPSLRLSRSEETAEDESDAVDGWYSPMVVQLDAAQIAAVVQFERRMFEPETVQGSLIDLW